MGNFIELAIGQQFGRLIVIRRAEKASNGAILWECKCYCGNTTTVRGSDLRRGNVKSCGCFQREIASAQAVERCTIHGLAGTNTYRFWSGMKKRCYNPHHKYYDDYGGRGIIVCDEWKDSFEAFYKDMGEHPEGMSLDRINNNSNYTLDNCRWASIYEQHNNKRDNTYITHNGKEQTISQWSQECGIKSGTISSRLRNGWSVEDALTKPVQIQKRVI